MAIDAAWNEGFMQEQKENTLHRFTPRWWEILAYALMIALAVILSAMQFPKWVVVPLVLAIILVRVARIHLTKRKQGS